MEIKFKGDTSFRKQFFVPGSIAHPAKMDAQLLIWIVEKYTVVGETILDPMAGSGTMMLACGLGRNVVLVELEQRFIRMCLNNWQSVKMLPQLGHSMGECPVLWGDARDILKAREHPYEDLWLQYPKLDYATIKSIRRQRKLPLKGDALQLEGLLADKCIFSPPYAEAQEGAGIAKRGYRGPKHGPTDLIGKRSYMPDVHGNSDGQIGNLPYGNIDAVVTSPPYEGLASRDRSQEGYEQSKWGDDSPYFSSLGANAYSKGYGDNKANIGNLKSSSYLDAMLQVYAQCYSVLKEGGLMILVTKNFIRQKQVIRLDTDTIKLCEQAGFRFVERCYRKLARQSFWRVIYHKKFPGVEKLEHEDILVFQRSEAERSNS